MAYPFLIIVRPYPKVGETSCVDNITELKAAEESTDNIQIEQTSEILLIPDADEKQHLYRCKQVGCGIGYSTEHELHLHEAICCNGKNFTCDTCKETFKDKYTLRIHMYLHQKFSSRKKYSCPYDSCSRYYYMKRSLDSHIKSHEEKKHECTYPGCGKKLSHQGTLKKHMLVHRRKELTCNKTVGSAVPEFMCDICRRSFKTRINLERHMSDHQDLSEKILTCSNNEEHLNNETNTQNHVCHHNGLPCDICKNNSITKSNMQSHMSVHQNEDFFCDLCDKNLKTKEDIERHMLLHERKGFPCNFCEKVLTRKAYLQRHMLLLHDNKVPCDICKKMKTKEQLKFHMFVHEKEKFVCDLCKRELKSKKDIERHMFLHEGTGFPCSICGKAFTRKDSVQRHMVLHTEGKVPCDICNKMLSRRQLKVHRSCHFKQFPCDKCNRIFRRKGNLIRHISLHNGEVFPCHICKKILLTKEEMQTHLSFHQEKKFSCHICKTLFSSLRNKHRHMSLHKRVDFLGITCSKLLRTKKYMSYHQRQIFTCVKCKMNFTSLARKQKHVCLETEVPPHSICMQTFKKETEDQRHMTDQEEPSKNETSHCLTHRRSIGESVMQKRISLQQESLEKEDYACDICNRLFRTRKGLRRHMPFHEDLTERKMFFCSDCSKGYIQRRNLLYHIKHAHEGKEFKGNYVEHNKEPAARVDIASSVAAEECKQTTEGMQTRGDSALSSLTTSSQKYEHGRKWLLENKNMLHESLRLKSQHYKGEKDKLWMSVRILIQPVHIQRTSQIVRESPQSADTQVQKLYDSTLFTSENCVPSGNQQREQYFELKKDVTSSNNEQQEGKCNGVDPVNFKMNVHKRICIMKRIMEEMFPTIKSIC